MTTRVQVDDRHGTVALYLDDPTGARPSALPSLPEVAPASFLDVLFPANGVADWTKFSGGSLSVHMFDMAAFAHAWAPLERRWEAGGVPTIRPFPRAHAL